MVFVEAEWNYWSVTIGTLISVVVIAIIWIMYTLRINCTEMQPRAYLLTQIVSSFTLFFLLCSAILNSTDYTMVIPPRLCEPLLFIVWVVFGFYKGGLYVVYVARLDAAYKDSAFQISSCLKYALRFIVVQHFFVFTLLISFGVFVNKSYSYVDAYSFCTFNLSLFVMAYYALMDVIFPLFCLGLFIRPLKQLQKQQRDRFLSQLDIDDALLRLCFKYTIITAVAVISSVVLLIIVALFGIWIPTPIDFITNAICIISYDMRYSCVYYALCKRCEDMYANIKADASRSTAEMRTRAQVGSSSVTAPRSLQAMPSVSEDPNGSGRP